ncbi:MAG: GmrSD restriction endonuclease domain-containing protein [Candidatus Binatia bacterium]
MTDQKDEIPEITPQVVHLIDLLKRAKEGRLRVPNFQRDFVWRRQDIADLFDSIARQYPIGTLFLWGAQTALSSRPRIGPLSLPKYKGETWLVLDGQQRLTTLVGVLLADERKWSTEDDADPERWRLFFDAKHNVFSHAKPDESIPSSYIPVPALLDTLKLFTHMESMLRSTDSVPQREGLAREIAFQWISRAQEVARAIQSYRIPLVEIKTNNLGIAVESFSRLNKKGRDIGQDEMFSALTYREGDTGAFHLAAEIDKLQEEMIRSDFGKVDRTILLRAVLTAADIDMYRTDWTLLGDQLKENVRNKLPQAVNEATRGLEHARQFLRELGVLNGRMLPYSMQLVALSAFYGRCSEPTTEQLRLLRRWFWSSSFAGWFGSGNSARVRRLVDELRDAVSKNRSPKSLEYMDLDQPALPTPLRFDLRSARVRTMICVLLAQKPRRPNGSELGLEEAARLLFERGPDSMCTLCATVGDGNLRKSPANRIVDVAPDVKGQAKNWIRDLPIEVRDLVLSSHAIEPESFDSLLQGRNDEFLQRRMAYLSRIEREFMQNVEVTPPTSDAPALSPIDTDEI